MRQTTGTYHQPLQTALKRHKTRPRFDFLAELAFILRFSLKKASWAAPLTQNSQKDKVFIRGGASKKSTPLPRSNNTTALRLVGASIFRLQASKANHLIQEIQQRKRSFYLGVGKGVARYPLHFDMHRRLFLS
jgi:hypothetical protein